MMLLVGQMRTLLGHSTMHQHEGAAEQLHGCCSVNDVCCQRAAQVVTLLLEYAQLGCLSVHNT